MGLVATRACVDFASAATLALAIFFCFWLRCFDLGDLSLMVLRSMAEAIHARIAVYALGGKG
jgi:hypothetical protein